MTLLIGFDSAWTSNNAGALAAVLVRDDGTLQEFELPRIANYAEAEDIVVCWQKQFAANSTVILLDQPLIVSNLEGQRPVEGIVSSPISARLGGMQPASISRAEMFGPKAPVWPFLQRFGGPANPCSPSGSTLVFETYPVLTLIALGWTLPDSRVTGRLPKYNPQRRKTFSIDDWRHVCSLAEDAFRSRGMKAMAGWLEQAAAKHGPRKSDQDRLDACLCLLVALYMAEGRDCLMVGDTQTGYIVVPDNPAIFSELGARCRVIGLNPANWVRTFRHERAIVRESSGEDCARETHVPCLEPRPPGESLRPTIDWDEARAVLKSCGLRSDQIEAAIAKAEEAKPYHSMTPAERVADRIARNRAREQTSVESAAGWSLPSIVAQLGKHRQRASYGAVAGLLGVFPRGLMNGRPKSPEYSWVVAGSGHLRGWPTGYAEQQIHPECLRQILRASDNIIDNSDQLRTWLATGAKQFRG